MNLWSIEVLLLKQLKLFQRTVQYTDRLSFSFGTSFFLRSSINASAVPSFSLLKATAKLKQFFYFQKSFLNYELSR